MSQAFIRTYVKRLAHVKLNDRCGEQDQQNIKRIAIPNLAANHEHVEAIEIWHDPNQEENGKIQHEAKKQLFPVAFDIGFCQFANVDFILIAFDCGGVA